MKNRSDQHEDGRQAMRLEAKLLEGDVVQLEPLIDGHIPALWEVAQHEEIWRYMPFSAASFEEFEQYLHGLLRQRDNGLALPFANRLKATGALVGSTSYLAIDEPNLHLEIGATWITPGVQRSAVNTETKLLQLVDAFERLKCNRVEFKTDSLNTRSRAAILRLGAVEEGTFRNHMVMPDGRLRHSVWYAITKEEWPAVKANLTARLKAAG